MSVQEDSKPDMLNPGSNSSGMGSGAGSSSAGSPASKPNATTTNNDYQQESHSSPASIHVAVRVSIPCIMITYRVPQKTGPSYLIANILKTP